MDIPAKDHWFIKKIRTFATDQVMLYRLQKKWNVSVGRLVLILVTFACGGSLTGIAGKKVLSLTGIEAAWLYIPIYIIVITLIWPIMVLLLSIPLGQFSFFRNYIRKLGSRFTGKRTTNPLQQAPVHDHLQQPAMKRIAIFASGAGSNAQKIIDYFREVAAVQVSLIVCNKPKAGVIAIAEKEGIPVRVVEKEQFFRGDAYVQELLDKQIDLVVLAGFLWKIPDSLIAAFPRRIINIHPALLPNYGGKGMYGQFVHEAVLKDQATETGITIHYVDEHYDNGDIIFQARCPVLPADTAADIANRVHTLEHTHYPRVIEKVLSEM